MPVKATLAQVLEFVRSASAEERSAIIGELNAQRLERIVEAKGEFKVGDKVAFDVRKRGHPPTIVGHIKEKRVKRFVIRPANGGKEWIVQADLVRKVF